MHVNTKEKQVEGWKVIAFGPCDWGVGGERSACFNCELTVVNCESVVPFGLGITCVQFYGQQNLEGYGSWGHEESDRTEQLSTEHIILMKLK